MSAECLVRNIFEPKFANIFRFNSFSNLQMILLPSLLSDDANMVVNSPTGSGKTCLFELAIIRIINKSEHDSLMIYIAPTKGIIQEKVRDWSQKFGPFGVNIVEMTGDVEGVKFEHLSSSTIILTTPDKFEIVSRSFLQLQALLEKIKLLMIDEIHFLGEDVSRGYKLETLIIRMKLIQKKFDLKFRIIGCSATLQNACDIGRWLNCKPENVHKFDETFRPVPLYISTISFGSGASNPFLFDKVLDSKVWEVYRKFNPNPNNNQTLVFCHSKANTEKLAHKFSEICHFDNRDELFNNNNNNLFNSINLAKLVNCGLAYHHSGLGFDDRQLVESLFIQGKIRVLFSTTTLAYGVNLPAFLIIVKGTKCWRDGAYKSLSRIEVSQMVGRAGRKGLDDSGVAVIMTSNEEKFAYANLSKEIEVIDSNLEKHLIESIGCEITLKIIKSLDDCVDWLQQSFFAVMLKKNSAVSSSSSSSDELIREFCERIINKLLDNNFLTYNTGTTFFRETYANNIMTRNLLCFESVLKIINISSPCTMYNLLSCISNCSEMARPLR